MRKDMKNMMVLISIIIILFLSISMASAEDSSPVLLDEELSDEIGFESSSELIEDDFEFEDESSLIEEEPTEDLINSYIETDLPYYSNVRIGDEFYINASLHDGNTHEIIDSDFDVSIIREYYGGENQVVSSYLVNHGNGSVNVDTNILTDGDYYRVLISYNGSSVYGPCNHTENGGLPYLLPKARIPTTLLFDAFEEFSTSSSIDLEFNLLDNWKWYEHGVEGARIIDQDISVYLNDGLYAIRHIDIDADVPITIENLATGENRIKFSFGGTEIYDACSYEFTIIHYNVRSAIRFEELDYSQSYGQDIIFNTILYDDSNGEAINESYTLLVYTDDDYYFNPYNPLYQKTVKGNETVTIPSGLFSMGNQYWAVAKFDGKENISSSRESSSFYMVSDDREISSISIVLEDIQIHDNLKCTINLLTSLSSHLDERIHILLYDLDSWSINDPAMINLSGDSNREIELDTSNLNLGRYVLKAIFDGNSLYKGDESYVFFNIVKRSTSLLLSCEGTEFDLGQTASISFALSDGIDSILRPILLTINGEEMTVENGRHDFSPKDAGAYDLTARFLGDEYCCPCDSNSLRIVFKTPEVKPVVVPKATGIICSNMKTIAIDSKIDGKKGAYFSLALKDISGNPLSGKKVLIILNKVKYTVKTNSKGIAKLQINVKKAGTYKLAISFGGDSSYKASSAHVSLKVNKQKPKMIAKKKTFKLKSKIKRIRIALKTSRKKALNKKRLVVTIKGKKYKAKTNKRGIAAVKLKLNRKGKYIYRIRFAGDRTYKAISKKVKVIVK